MFPYQYLLLSGKGTYSWSPNRTLALGYQHTCIFPRRFKTLVGVLNLNDKIIELALNDEGFKDFEDGLQYYTALEHNQNTIINRNLRDFKNSKIPVMTAEEYLSTLDHNVSG